MESGDLELQDGRGNTAFCVAAATGSVNIAKILMDENADLAFIRGAENRTPLYIAAVCGYPEMLRFLYKKFEPHIPCLHEEEQRGIFFACIRAGLFDLAIRMLEVLGDVLAWPPNDDEETALEILARTPSAFAGKSSTTPKTLIDMCFGSNTINMQHNALKLTKLLCETMTSDQRKSYEETTDHASKLLFEAARLGNYNFLTVLVGFFPDLIFRKDEKRKSIFHIAVLHRHAGIFTHIHNLGLRKDLIMLYRVNYSDQENPIVYNMLHLAAKLPSLDRLNIVSGAALQMQRELLWFKEVENLTPPSEREMRDSKDELTPQELFTKEHEELRKAGETWMKKTAEAGMIVATIITTVVFTTASSLPGGTDGGDGSPKNKDKTMFHI
ncbi:protein of unknown function DUF3447 - like 10 [Theobroma cacao]|nr:protein of unknown function DUF3447 - like 10 [Theobroma cacao]